MAVYERLTRSVRCEQCPREPGIPVDSGPPNDQSKIDAHQDDDADVAGGSARREYERRKNAREQRIRAQHPKLGGLILALSDEPQSTRAWEQGAVGEELLAARLKELPSNARVLHDRRISGTRANIDHIVIAPSGVWVIDAKRYKGKRPALHVEGGILRPRTESLRIGGRDGTKLVNAVTSQVQRVTAALANPGVDVFGVLCFLESDWPLFGGDFTVNDIRVLWPRLLVKRISGAHAREPVDVDDVYSRVATAFPQHR